MIFTTKSSKMKSFIQTKCQMKLINKSYKGKLITV